MRLPKFALPSLLAGCLFASASEAATGYLPVQLDSLMEARIEKLLVLASQTVIRRPISVAQVEQALQQLGDREPLLRKQVESYLERYQASAAISHAQVEVAVSDGTNHVRPNQLGLETDSAYNASLQTHWAPADWVRLNIGAVAHQRSDGEEDTFAEGSYLSLGGRYLQLDAGYRTHWMSPFQESAMLVSSNASAVPGVTFSNVIPISRLGFGYEIFFAQMSESDKILSQERDQRLSGNPKLFGVHLSVQPIQGFALGLNRLMQYGGADRDESFESLLKAFFNAKDNDNIGREGVDFGNQLSSVTTRYSFGDDFPVSVYMEYAGEDTSNPSDYHLGNTSLMFGVHLPKLTESVDLTFETAEWQNGWYVNHNYGDGLTNFHSIMGHWGAENRVQGDAVGASAQTLKLFWDLGSDKTLLTKIRQVDNKSYSANDYDTGRELFLEYSQPFQRYRVGASLTVGSDVFGENYSAATGFIRW